MSASALFPPELAEMVRCGSSQRRTRTLERITALFLDGASRFNEDHVKLFDRVLGTLIDEIDTEARSRLARCLAAVGNAPAEVVRRLALDDEIEVARPVLERSTRLGEADLVEIARTSSQAHLLAISGRHGIDESITDVLAQRGDQAVARKLAENASARLSDDGFARLVGRAEGDDVLADNVAVRRDIPPRLLRDLLLTASDAKQRPPGPGHRETRAEAPHGSAHASKGPDFSPTARNYSTAQHEIAMLCREDMLDESMLVDYARKGRYEETVVALARLCAIPIEVVDRLMDADRSDPVLVLCRSVGWGWSTAKALIMARAGMHGRPCRGLDAAQANFDRLSPATAQRVMRFWQVRAV
jgi:uncharacterized protein (DUF2336 family)